MRALPTREEGRGRTGSLCCQNACVTIVLQSALVENINMKSFKMLVPIHDEQEILVISHHSDHHPVD